jgi:hypothetical protein
VYSTVTNQIMAGASFSSLSLRTTEALTLFFLNSSLFRPSFPHLPSHFASQDDFPESLLYVF